MLQDRSDSQQRQLQDALAFEIIPRLSLLDAQSLGQTCSSLRNLLKTDVPGSTFRTLANKTFPPDHPMLAIDDSDLQTEIEKLAATHARIRGVHAASVSMSYFQEGGRPCDTAIVLNHAGDHALRGHDRELELYQCNMDAEPMSLHLVWKHAAPPRHAHDHSAPRFFWSPDDRWACIWYDSWDVCVDLWAVHVGSSSQATYLWHLDTQDAYQVTDDRKMDTPEDPCFSPDSNIMLIPWRKSVTTGTIDIFSWSERQIIARVRDPWRSSLGACPVGVQPFLSQIRFSPDSLHFAATRGMTT